MGLMQPGQDHLIRVSRASPGANGGIKIKSFYKTIPKVNIEIFNDRDVRGIGRNDIISMNMLQGENHD